MSTGRGCRHATAEFVEGPRGWSSWDMRLNMRDLLGLGRLEVASLDRHAPSGSAPVGAGAWLAGARHRRRIAAQHGLSYNKRVYLPPLFTFAPCSWPMAERLGC